MHYYSSKSNAKMENLKDFMLIFRMEINPQFVPSQEQLSSMKMQWGNWIGKIAQKARLVSSHQLGFEGNIIKADGEVKRLEFLSQNQSISGNMVLKATDLTEATEIAKGSPILLMGGTVEIRNTLNNF